MVKNKMEQMMQSLAAAPQERALMSNLEKLSELVMPLPLGLNLWKVQNTYWEMAEKTLPAFQQRAQNGDEAARGWVNRFLSLGDHLGFAAQSLQTPAVPLKAAA